MIFYSLAGLRVDVALQTQRLEVDLLALRQVATRLVSVRTGGRPLHVKALLFCSGTTRYNGWKVKIGGVALLNWVARDPRRTFLLIIRGLSFLLLRVTRHFLIKLLRESNEALQSRSWNFLFLQARFRAVLLALRLLLGVCSRCITFIGHYAWPIGAKRWFARFPAGPFRTSLLRALPDKSRVCPLVLLDRFYLEWRVLSIMVFVLAELLPIWRGKRLLARRQRSSQLNWLGRHDVGICFEFCVVPFYLFVWRELPWTAIWWFACREYFANHLAKGRNFFELQQRLLLCFLARVINSSSWVISVGWIAELHGLVNIGKLGILRARNWLGNAVLLFFGIRLTRRLHGVPIGKITVVAQNCFLLHGSLLIERCHFHRYGLIRSALL